MLTAKISGSSFSRGPEVTVETIHEAKQLAKSFGNTADLCVVYDGDTEVARFARNRDMGGMTWDEVE